MHFLGKLETALILFTIFVSFLHYDASEGESTVPSFMPSLWVTILALAILIHGIQ